MRAHCPLTHAEGSLVDYQDVGARRATNHAFTQSKVGGYHDLVAAATDGVEAEHHRRAVGIHQGLDQHRGGGDDVVESAPLAVGERPRGARGRSAAIDGVVQVGDGGNIEVALVLPGERVTLAILIGGRGAHSDPGRAADRIGQRRISGLHLLTDCDAHAISLWCLSGQAKALWHPVLGTQPAEACGFATHQRGVVALFSAQPDDVQRVRHSSDIRIHRSFTGAVVAHDEFDPCGA